MKRRKLKAVAMNKQVSTTAALVHDRQATVLPANAVIAVIEIDDPFERGARNTATISLRDDPLGALFARHQIDDAKYVAGRRWQHWYETSMIGSLKGQDTTREPVDGGGIPLELLNDERRRAVKWLARCAQALGRDGDALVRDVLGKGMFIAQAADARGCVSKQAIEYVGKRFRECLECLAKEFGYA